MSRESRYMSQYFTYGEMRPEVVEAVIGRPLDRVIPAGLTGYGLFLQTSVDIKPDVRELLALPRTPEEIEAFRTSVAVRHKPTSVAKGAIVDVHPDELEALNFFNIEGKWFELQNGLHALAGEDRYHARVKAHILPQAQAVSLTPIPDHEGMFHLPLNDPVRTLEIAAGARRAFLAERS